MAMSRGSEPVVAQERIVVTAVALPAAQADRAAVRMRMRCRKIMSGSRELQRDSESHWLPRSSRQRYPPRVSSRLLALSVTVAVALGAVASPAIAPKKRSIKTITVTSTSSSPLAFKGVPRTLKRGTYRFRYVNKSGVGHNLRFLKSPTNKRRTTPVFRRGARTVTVTFTKRGKARYECTPHRSVMKGTIRIR